jgi:hypothetical protein
VVLGCLSLNRTDFVETSSGQHKSERFVLHLVAFVQGALVGGFPMLCMCGWRQSFQGLELMEKVSCSCSAIMTLHSTSTALLVQYCV